MHHDRRPIRTPPPSDSERLRTLRLGGPQLQWRSATCILGADACPAASLLALAGLAGDARLGVAVAGPGAGAATSPCGRTQDDPDMEPRHRDRVREPVLRERARRRARRRASSPSSPASAASPRTSPPPTSPTACRRTSPARAARCRSPATACPGRRARAARRTSSASSGHRSWRAFGAVDAVARARRRTPATTSPATCPRSTTRASPRRPAPPTCCRCRRRSGRLKRKFVWIAPDQMSDMEIGTPAQASAWLQNFLEGPAGILTHAPYTAGPHRGLHLVRHGRERRHRLDAAARSSSSALHAAHALVARPERLQRAAGVGAHARRPVRERRLHGDPHGRVPPVATCAKRGQTPFGACTALLLGRCLPGGRGPPDPHGQGG